MIHEDHERLQVHKRRRDVEPEVEEVQAPVVRENARDPHFWDKKTLPYVDVW